MFLLHNAYRSEFRRNVVAVAMNRELRVTLEKTAADFRDSPDDVVGLVETRQRGRRCPPWDQLSRVC